MRKYSFVVVAETLLVVQVNGPVKSPANEVVPSGSHPSRMLFMVSTRCSTTGLMSATFEKSCASCTLLSPNFSSSLSVARKCTVTVVRSARYDSSFFSISSACIRRFSVFIMTLTSVIMSTADLFRPPSASFGLGGTEPSKKMASRLRFTESRTTGLPVSFVMLTAGDEVIMIFGVIMPAGVSISKHVLRSGRLTIPRDCMANG